MNYHKKPWREQLESIKDLPEGWDDYGSPPLTDEQYNNAKLFLEKIEGLGFEDPWMCPCAGGGIQLEWQYDNKELEVDFTSDKVGYLKVFDADKEMKNVKEEKFNLDDGNMEEGEFDISNEDMIFELMHWLVSG